MAEIKSLCQIVSYVRPQKGYVSSRSPLRITKFLGGGDRVNEIES